MNKYFIATITSLSIVMAGCSSGSSGGGSPALVDNLVTQTYADVVAQSAKASGGASASLSSAVSVRNVFSPRTAPDFGVYWDTTPAMNNPVTNSGTITVKEFMGIQLDPTAVRTENGSAVNLFGRLAQTLKVFCAIGVGTGYAGVATDSNGYPADGTHSITFSAAVKATMLLQCGMDVSDMADGEVVSVTVSTIGGNYDKSFDLDGLQVYLVRATATEVNIATGELHDDGTSVSRAVVIWNKTTGVMRMQYVSNPGSTTPGQSGLYGYRLYYDETADEAQAFVYEGSDSAVADATRFIIAGKPTTGNLLSISFKNQNVEGGSTLEACISTADGSLFDDGARCSAGATALNGAAIDAGATGTMITNFFGQKTETGWVTVAPTTTLNWTTMSNMLTVDFDHSI